MRLNPLEPFTVYIRPYRRMIVPGLLLLIGVQAITAAIPMILKWGIDTGKAGLDAIQAQGTPPLDTSTTDIERDLIFYAVLIAVLALIHWVMSAGMRWYLMNASRYVERDIRAAYVRHLLTLPLSFFQQRRVGDLMARATSDLETIQRFLSHAFRMTLTGGLMFVLSLAMMCTLDWKLAVYALAPIPVMVLTARIVAGKVRHGYREVQEQFGSMLARIQENLAGIRVVKAFGRRIPEIERFGRLNETYVEKNRRLVRIRSMFYPFTALLNGASLVIILWLGGLRVIDGAFTLGAFVAFNAYLIRMSRPMMLLGRMVDEYQRAMTSMSRINKILREKPQIQDETPAEETPALRGEIEFRNLRFAYNGRTVLDNISLRVPAGSTLAVVGRVGSGKTTLARLIPRLIEAGEGQVLIDGKPIEAYSLPMIRNAIGYVPQDTFLFSDTIRENVSLGLNDADDEQVLQAADISQLSPDLEIMPRKLDTIVGERGVTLSGGQKQRTALARAVIRRPQILILDDAMASVDTHTEEEILTRLRDVMKTRTTILIAHRISTVKHADYILVLDEGRIAEQGAHDELIARNGLYADMYRRQHIVEELDEM